MSTVVHTSGQLLGVAAIALGLLGTWVAARRRVGWVLCIASAVFWLPTMVTGSQWVAVGNIVLTVGICMRNFLLYATRNRLQDAVELGTGDRRRRSPAERES